MGTVRPSCIALSRDVAYDATIVYRWNPKYESDLWLVRLSSGATTIAHGSMLQEETCAKQT